MSYLDGKRFVGPITPTVLSSRKELYTIPYHDIHWNQARNLCAKKMSMEVIVQILVVILLNESGRRDDKLHKGAINQVRAEFLCLLEKQVKILQKILTIQTS
ncbi:hypothetical protein L6164_007216 [Bauhinia variegata]|uniref:Uncharacterized protein n=1 Tax=Bauhinia variegata TaxID=167791 RepID=A0ACB9PCU9_BAUVA|nr:hypothetical protein L6164_007216 [Bauhinia variegata]